MAVAGDGRLRWFCRASERAALPTACAHHHTRLRCSNQVKEEYLACLKEHGNDTEPCRHLAKRYLECRMERCVARAMVDCCRAGASCLRRSSPRPPHPPLGPAPAPRCCSNLMAQQDLKQLGFREGEADAPPPSNTQPKAQQQPPSDERRPESAGFIAGTKRFN